MKTRILLLSLLLSTAAFAAEQDANPLALDAKAAQAIGVVTAVAETRAMSQELKAPGEVKADAYSTVLVSPRVEAQVVSRKAKLGDAVKAGQPLVVLSSVQVAETQGALIVAEQDWQRVASLGAQAVSARRYSEAKVARDQARAKLRAFGLSDAQINASLRAGSAQADGSYELVATIDGRVATDDFLVGERVEPGKTLFTITRDDKVWVEAQLTSADAAHAKPNLPARVVARGASLQGRVIVNAVQTNERTRTVPVRIEVDNAARVLRPGELVETYIAIGEGTSALAVPTESIVLLQNQPTLFVQKKDGTGFSTTPIEVGMARDGWTVVTQGLALGDTYVAKGSFALKARLLRSQLGED